MNSAELAQTKELAFLMTERFSMNPISAKLLNEAWAKTFPDEVAVAERMMALVEALEKAQAAMTAVVAAASIRGIRPFDGVDCAPPSLEENAEACGDTMSARIRELEANPPKPHHNGLMQLSNELAMAKQRIADLESRTVTVKLPPRVDSSNVPFTAHTWNCCLDAVEEFLTAAGIQVIEGEG